MGFVKASTIAARFIENNLPDMYLAFYPLKPVKNKWWGILLGYLEDGNLMDEHIDVWVNMLLDSRPKNAKCTIMVSNFFEFLVVQQEGSIQRIPWPMVLLKTIHHGVHPYMHSVSTLGSGSSGPGQHAYGRLRHLPTLRIRGTICIHDAKILQDPSESVQKIEGFPWYTE